MNVPLFVYLIFLPVIASPLIYLSGHLKITQTRQTFAWLPRNAAFLILLIEWLVFALVARDSSAAGVESASFEAIKLRFDGISLLLTALILLLGTLVVLFSGPYLQSEHGQEKYYAVLTAMIGAMLGLICAADLFNLWLWFECMAVSSYLLVAFYREQPQALEACIKYLVQSVVGSVLVLIGIALILVQAGTLDLEIIRSAASRSPLLLASGALFIVGFGVKAALVPMHTWLPDAHSYAPSGISAMLSGVVIEVGLIAMLRVLVALAGVSLSWGVLLMGFGALNMLTGNLFALRQKSVKRLLAYSSLSHMGYILLGVGIGLYAGQQLGVQGGMFHLFNHGLMKGLAFLSIGALLYVLHIANHNENPLTINELSGAAQRYPLTAFALSLSVLGLAGLPPMAGFFSKWQIFVAGFAAHDLTIDLLIIFAALNSVLSLAYYFPLVNMVYRQQQSIAVLSGARMPFSMSVPLVALSFVIAAIGFWPTLVDWLTIPASSAIMQALGQAIGR